MRDMELTPELFEKTEFTERRRGYDIDQVETFLEEAGTALAQMLAKVRHTEERAAHAEARLAETDQRIAQFEAATAAAERRAAEAEARVNKAEAAAREAMESAQNASRAGEQAEVEQAAKTLLMAKRTAEATINEARGQAQSLLEDSQTRAQRQVNEAQAEAEQLLVEARRNAEAEYADRKARAAAEVESLDSRRSQLVDVIAQLESRLAAYRDDLSEAAQELLDLAANPERLGGRPQMSLHPDEVLQSPGPERVEPDDGGGGGAGRESAPAESEATESEPVRAEGREAPASTASPEASASATNVVNGDSGGVMTATTIAVEDTDSRYVDLTTSPSPTTAGEHDRWAPGSWSEVAAELDEDVEQRAPSSGPEPELHDDQAQADGAAAGSSADGAHRDRFMEELDSAVNEAVPVDDDAMTAFFEGSGESRSRRFGWRR